MSSKVQLYIYDVTRGLAAQMSSFLLGHHIDGVWHTGIVCYGREYFFGSGGIDGIRPGTTILGAPMKIMELGETQLPVEVFQEYLFEVGGDQFRPEKYDLFLHNCNTFSNEVSQFLTGKKIPSYILDLPSNILNTPLGAMLRSFMDGISAPSSNAYQGRNFMENTGASSDQPPQNQPSFVSSARNEKGGTKSVDSKAKVLTFSSELTGTFERLQEYLAEKDEQIIAIKQFIDNGEYTAENSKDVIINLNLVFDALRDCEHESSHFEAFLSILGEISLKIPIQLIQSSAGSKLLNKILKDILRNKEDATLLNIMKIGTNLCSDAEARSMLTDANNSSGTEMFDNLRYCCLECFHETCKEPTHDAAISFCYNLTLSKLDDESEIELAAVLTHWFAGSNEKSRTTERRCAEILKTWMKANEQVKELVEMTIDGSKLE
eukprot:gene8944-9898_t